MRTVTKQEMGFLLTLLKNPTKKYNANSLAKDLGMSSMGVLKIGKRLLEEGVLHIQVMGKAHFYILDLSHPYTQSYLSYILLQEKVTASPYVKRWIRELQKIRAADIILLFGSVLKREKDAQDVDVLFVTDTSHFPKLKKEIEQINLLSAKKIHPVYQTRQDFTKNLLTSLLVQNAVQGIVVKGEDIFLQELSL